MCNAGECVARGTGPKTGCGQLFDRFGRRDPRSAVDEAGFKGAVKKPQAGGAAFGKAFKERRGTRLSWKICAKIELRAAMVEPGRATTAIGIIPAIVRQSFHL